MRAPYVRLVAVMVLVAFSFCSGLSRALTIQDLVGGASQILMARPKNPPVRHRSTSTRALPGTQPGSGAAGTADSDKNQRPDQLLDEAEDALALGNSARDAEPPRYSDAEKAYKLAIRLNPKDPRAYIGLANIWYDQKQYAEAAKMYREAVLRMAPTTKPSGAANSSLASTSVTARTVRGKPTQPTRGGTLSVGRRGEWQAYLGNALLQQGQFPEAEIEFRKAIADDSNDAQWHALLGYSLLEQKKYREATTALEKAVELAPEKPEYKKLLNQALTHKNQN